MLEILAFSNFKLLNAKQAYSDKINSIEFIWNKKILVTASYYDMIKLWDIFTLQLIRNLKSHLMAPSYVKFGLNRLYSSGYDGKIYYYNQNISESQNVIKTKSFKSGCLTVSIELQLIAFGLKTLNLYCLKDEIEIGSVILKGYISSLAFVKSIIVCGTHMGQLFFVESQSLIIKKQFALSSSQIYYCLGSKDFNQFVYSLKNK